MKFPPQALGHITSPATIVDYKGRIGAWYLPGMLSPEKQASLSIFLQLSFSHAFDLDRIGKCDSLHFSGNEKKCERSLAWQARFMAMQPKIICNAEYLPQKSTGRNNALRWLVRPRSFGRS
jgi:hypothetical protein